MQEMIQIINALDLPNFWVGEEVTILIWKRENWRGGGNFQTIAAHTILKVIGPRFFQRRKRSRRGRWSRRRRSYCTPNTKVSQRMCFRHAITEFKTLLQISKSAPSTSTETPGMSEKWRNPSTLPILHKTTRISPYIWFSTQQLKREN